MATNFSPCKGSYVLNQFPSNVMFGMNGFHVSASGAIQGHHGPLVLKLFTTQQNCKLAQIESILQMTNITQTMKFLSERVKKKKHEKRKQEGHDGPVSLHWLILGNLFKR